MDYDWQSLESSANARSARQHSPTPKLSNPVTRQRRPAPMNLKPLEDRIVVKPNEAETQTASGLVIPDTAKEKPQQGSVLAVGPGKRAESSGELIALDIKVGDTVL